MHLGDKIKAAGATGYILLWLLDSNSAYYLFVARVHLGRVSFDSRCTGSF